MDDPINSTDLEFLRLLREGREEEARQYAIEHISALSPNLADDILTSLSDERIDLDVLQQEEEVIRRRKVG